MGGAQGRGGEAPGKISSVPIHDGRIVHLSIDTVRFPDGSVGELEMIRHSGASAVLPLLGRRDDPDPDILLIRQYRYASGGYLLEVPAGRPDEPGEDWELCARRELEEETGYSAERVTRMTGIFTTPGFTDEFIELERLPLSRALDLIQQGEITDGKTVCAILFARSFLLSGRLPQAPDPTESIP